jgi:hypothetical protein
MQSKPRILGALAFAACMCASGASADFKPFGYKDLKTDNHQYSGSMAQHNHRWWHFFSRHHHSHGNGNGHGHGHGGHHNGGGHGDCKVPEIPTSGLPSMAAVALGGVAIVLSRRGRRDGV